MGRWRVALAALCGVTLAVTGVQSPSGAAAAGSQHVQRGRQAPGRVGVGTRSSRRSSRARATSADRGASAASTSTSATSELVGWGDDSRGQLGTGFTSAAVRIPAVVRVPAGVTFTSVSLGGVSLAIGSDGKLYSWGTGALGDGTERTRTVPAPITLAPGVRAVQLAPGGGLLVLGSDGHVYTWGSNTEGCLGDGRVFEPDVLYPQPVELDPGDASAPLGEPVTAIAGHGCHSAVVGASGTLYTWGDDSDGDTGVGGSVLDPPPPTVWATPVPLPGNAKAASVAAGDLYTLVTDTTGNLYAFGFDSIGQLGDGFRTDEYTPESVALPAGIHLRQISAANSSLALDTTGGVWQWGDGVLAPESVPLPGGATAASIGQGEGFQLADGANGLVYGWGDNTTGELGNGTTTNAAHPTPADLPGPASTSIFVGGASAMVAVVVPPTTSACTPTIGAGTLGAPTTTISGFLRYTASDGSIHPARYLSIAVLDQQTSGNVQLGTTTSDVLGHFAITVPTLRPGSSTHAVPFVRLRSTGTGFTIHPPDQTAAWSVSCGAATATGQSQFVTLTATPNTSAGAAMDVADTLTTGVEYTRRINDGSLFGNISVSFPDTETDFDSSTNTARVVRGDRFDWDVILHEYGHFVASKLGIDDSPGGDHAPWTNFGEPPNTKSDGIRLAWSEGFADYFSISSQYAVNAANLHIPNVGDTTYTDTEDQTLSYDLASTTPASPGEDSEESVARALWSCYQDPTIATRLTDVDIISTLKAAGVTTLSDAVTALMNAAGAYAFTDPSPIGTPASLTMSNAFGCVLSSQNVSPTVTTPADGATVDYQTPPTITWEPHGAGPHHRLNSFTVEIWDSTWQSLLLSSPTLATPTWQPSLAAWHGMLTNADPATGRPPATVRIVIKGSNSDSPATGPYKSCATTVAIAPSVTVTPAAAHLASISPACPNPNQTSNKFTVAATRLAPSTSYALTLTTAGYPTVKVGTVTTDSWGNTFATSYQLPILPSATDWTLRARPAGGSGPVASTAVDIDYTYCVALKPPAAHSFAMHWSGTGADPGSTVSITWDGSVTFTTTADSHGAWNDTEPMTCPAASNTVITTIPRLHDPTVSAAFLPQITCNP